MYIINVLYALLYCCFLTKLSEISISDDVDDEEVSERVMCMLVLGKDKELLLVTTTPLLAVSEVAPLPPALVVTGVVSVVPVLDFDFTGG